MSLTLAGAAPNLPLGTRRTGDPFALPAPEVFYDDAQLATHRDRPWLLAHLRSRHGLALTSKDVRTRPGAVAKRAGNAEGVGGAQRVGVPVDLLDRHALVIGATGSGKTRLSLHLLTERLRAGGSALVLDFKRDTVRQALLCAERAGMAASQVTVLWPGEAERGVPGWNPFAGDADELRQRVRQFVGLVKASANDASGTRMWDLLTSAATVIAGQGLSLVELLRFLQSPDYMAGLLNQARRTYAWTEYEEAHLYFDLEFASLSRAERGNYVAPVLNKIRALADIPYLKAMMGASRDTLDLPGLWRRPRLIAVHLDEYALGPDGARLLAGMLAHALYSLSARKPGNVGVTLMLDELASQERYLGSAVRDIVEKGRQQGLHLLCAGQHLEQISDELRKLLLSSCALRVFFRLGPDDALRAGKWLSTGEGSQPLRVALGVEKNVVWESWRHAILDPWGKPVRLEAGDWATFESVQATCWESTGEDLRRVPALRLLLERQGVARLYVRSADTNEVCELGAYVKGLPASTFAIQGPSPLSLLVSFPRPKVSVMGTRSEAERAGLIAQSLMRMPPQEAVVITDTGEKAQVRTVPVDFPDELPPVGAYLNSQEQSQEEMQATQQSRRAAIQALTQGTPAPPADPPPPAPGRPPQPAPQRKTASVRIPSAEGSGRAKAGEAASELKAAIAATKHNERAATQHKAEAVEDTREATAEPPAPRVPRPEVEDDGTI